MIPDWIKRLLGGDVNMSKEKASEKLKEKESNPYSLNGRDITCAYKFLTSVGENEFTYEDLQKELNVPMSKVFHLGRVLVDYRCVNIERIKERSDIMGTTSFVKDRKANIVDYRQHKIGERETTPIFRITETGEELLSNGIEELGKHLTK